MSPHRGRVQPTERDLGLASLDPVDPLPRSDPHPAGILAQHGGA